MASTPSVHADHFEPLSATLSKHQSALAQIRTGVTQPIDPVFDSDPTALYRYYKGWKWDIRTAIDRINTTQQYRASHDLGNMRKKAVELKQQQFPHADKILPHWPHVIMHGEDRQGQPLSIERLGHSRPAQLVAAVTLDELMEYHLYHLENKAALMAQLSVERDTVLRGCKIMDLEGLGRHHLHSKGFSYLKAILSVSQDHYPEMMGSLFIINAPRVFSLAWKMVKPILNENTLKKIHILGTDYQSVLQQYIDAQFIPEAFGGTCTCGGEQGCVPIYRSKEEDMTHLHIKAGAKHVERIQVPGTGAATAVENGASSASASVVPSPSSSPSSVYQLSYELKIESHDIGFSLSFSPLSASVPVILKPSTRCAHSDLVSDSVTVSECGTLELVFDNSYSRFTAKKLWYRVDISELKAEEIISNTQQQAETENNEEGTTTKSSE